MAAIFIAFDAIARIPADPDLSVHADASSSSESKSAMEETTSIDIGGGRSLLSIVLAQVRWFL